jgi:hypothetical protein
MDRFEYLAALVSVVAGLGLTRALSGFARIIHSEYKVALSGVHISWTFSIVLWLVGFWWFTFMLARVENWTVSLLLFVLLYGATIYLLIALLYPDKYEPGIDLFENFIMRRRSFFVTFVALGLIDIADTLIKTKIYNMVGPAYIPYSILMICWIGLGAVGAVTGNRIFHRFFAYSWLAVTSAWSVTTLVVL